MPDTWNDIYMPPDFMDELQVRELIEKRLREMCHLGLVCQNVARCIYRKQSLCDYPYIGNVICEATRKDE